MQLTPGTIAATLGALAAGLLGAASASAQESGNGTEAGTHTPNAYNETASEPGTLTADTALLVYQEDDDRVRAIEAEASLTWSDANGSVFTGKFTYDSLTGATPNGAIRSVNPQRFQPPHDPAVNGGHLPALCPIDGCTAASGTYITPAGQLPVDNGFKDHREAVDIGATLPVAEGLKLSIGGALSNETDFTSHSARISLAKDLNHKNTTLSLGFNYERDSVRPFTGVPQPLGDMGSDLTGRARVKQVYSMVAGATQVLTPNWLVQLNYSYGHSAGYHTDPYKLVSLVDGFTGNPFFSIYERRPDERNRHSIYAGTKLATGSFVTDASVRWYRDSWKINAWTIALSEHVPVGRSFYLEPEARWYHQSAANFFHPYLLIEDPLPDYASADSRLSRFGAWTLGIKGGAKLSSRIEIYGAAERYWQYGRHYDRSLPANLATTDLFAGSKSFSLISGIRLKFH